MHVKHESGRRRMERKKNENLRRERTKVKQHMNRVFTRLSCVAVTCVASSLVKLAPGGFSFSTSPLFFLYFETAKEKSKLPVRF
jgi:hypothetical protein